jgi:hypothetical protein
MRIFKKDKTCLECATLERSLEIDRLASEHNFMEIEVMRTTNDLTIGELFGLVESSQEVSQCR